MVYHDTLGILYYLPLLFSLLQLQLFTFNFSGYSIINKCVRVHSNNYLFSFEIKFTHNN